MARINWKPKSPKFKRFDLKVALEVPSEEKNTDDDDQGNTIPWSSISKNADSSCKITRDDTTSDIDYFVVNYVLEGFQSTGLL